MQLYVVVLATWLQTRIAGMHLQASPPCARASMSRMAAYKGPEDAFSLVLILTS